MKAFGTYFQNDPARPLAASFVLNRLCVHYVDQMSYVMGHPVSSRRYMGVEKY